MNGLQPSEDRSGCLSRLIVIGLVAATLFAFRAEIKLVWQFISGALKLLRGEPANLPYTQIFVLLAIIVLYIAFALLSLLLVSQFILPVSNVAQRGKAFDRMFVLLARQHQPLNIIKEGKLVSKLDKTGAFQPGIALIDLNSALVLEKKWMPFVSGAQKNTSSGSSKSKTAAAAGSVPTDGGQSPPPSSPVRVVGPGIAFTGFNERLRGIVSLRKQIRTNTEVHAYTSDGIEVTCNVSVGFTLGQNPKVIKVSYQGENAEDLRLVQIDPDSKIIKSFSDELDSQDKAEIHNFVQRSLDLQRRNAPLMPDDDRREYPPFIVDRERIFAAVYPQAFNVNESSPDNWTNLPAQVATEIFRSMLSKKTYDELYLPDDQEKFPLEEEFKPRFLHEVQSRGIMSYQFIHRRDGNLPEVGQTVDQAHFRIFPIRELRLSKVLRDRGIKVIFASFSELNPDQLVRRQRVERWRSRWLKARRAPKPDSDLEVIRVRNQAREEAQRDLSSKLTQIYNLPDSPEHLALNVFSALQAVAEDAETRRLLPQDTMEMLNSLQAQMFPAEQE